MSTKLERLLETIDPRRTLDDTSARVDRAVNTFSMPTARIERWIDFKACIIDFMHHVEATVLRARAEPEASLSFEWGRCVRLFMDLYGSNGEKAAFEMARTGNEGGLYAVLRRLARQIARQYGGNEVTARILHWWHGLTVDEQLDAPTEYIKKYGHLLPSELTEGSAARIRANFTKVLEEHPRLLQRMRRVGR